MSISQLIYTSTCTDAMTSLKAYQVSAKSVEVCHHLGLTGRVFADNQSALAFTEGPTEIVREYFKAVTADKLVESILLHVDRPIKKREFDDYAVLLNLPESFPVDDHVRPLTWDEVQIAMPKYPSAKLRLMAEAYLDVAVKVAS